MEGKREEADSPGNVLTCFATNVKNTWFPEWVRDKGLRFHADIEQTKHIYII